METVIEDFSLGLFIWQAFIFTVLVLFGYVLIKFLRRKLK